MVETFDGAFGAKTCALGPSATIDSSVTPQTYGAETSNFFQQFFALQPSSRQLILAEIEQGTLIRSGAVVTASRQLVRQSLWDDNQYRREFCPTARLARPKRLRARAATIVTAWHQNYYHWIFDGISRLMSLEGAGVTNVPVIVPANLLKFQLEVLERVGVARHMMVSHDNENLSADTLLWTTPPSHINFATPETIAWLRNRLDPTGPVRGTRRILVWRDSTRKFYNSRAVLDVALSFGFEIIQPELMTLDQQISVFREAEMVMGAHGAGITNAFLSRGATIIELFVDEFITAPFYTIACSMKVPYWYVKCRAAPGSVPGKDADLFVPVENLRETLRMALAERS